MALAERPADAWSHLQSRVRTDRPCSGGVLAAIAAGVLFVAGAAAVVPDHAIVRWAVALAVACALGYVAWRSFEQGVVVTFGWLLVLGLVRRLVSTFQADPGSDPLLLVGVAAVAVLVVVAVARGALREISLLGAGVLAMTSLAIVEAANPEQDRLTLGVRGLLFWVAPMLWFWVGRVARTALVERVLCLVTVVAGVAATYGLGQALIDFPPWDRRWIDNRGYRALEISGPDTLRQFGFSSSAGEYALLLTVGILLCVLYLAREWRADTRDPARIALPMVGLAVMTPALALASVRTAVVLLVLALAVVFVAARGRGSVTAVLAGAAALGLLWFGLSRIDTDGMDDHGPVGMLRRTIRGLADPLGQDSTLRTHLELFGDGFDAAGDRPLGVGTSAGTPVGPGFENDVANGGLAFGFLGLAGVTWCIAFGFVTAFRVVARHGGLVALAALGILVLSLRFWWSGAHYGAAALLWFVLGWADATARRDSRARSVEVGASTS
jgi:hypothetical protein